MGKGIPKIWYVSIRVQHRQKAGKYSRRSYAFASEGAAKQFAATRIAAGLEVSAGTLNPFLPKRIIGPSEIVEWLSREISESANRGAPT